MNKKHTTDWRVLCPNRTKTTPKIYLARLSIPHYCLLHRPAPRLSSWQRGEITATHAHFTYAERLSRKSNSRLVTLTSLTPESKSRLNKLRSG